MIFFIIKLFATILIFTHLPVSAMLAENESENQLKPTYSGPTVEVDLKLFEQCITISSYEECLSDVVDQVIFTFIEKCSTSGYGSDYFVEAVTSRIETTLNSLPNQGKLTIKLHCAPTVLAESNPGPDGPSRTDEGDEDDPLIISIPEAAWPWLDEGDSNDGY